MGRGDMVFVPTLPVVSSGIGLDRPFVQFATVCRSLDSRYSQDESGDPMENQRAVQASPDRPLELGHDDVGWTRRRQRLVEFRPAYSEGEPCVHPGRVYGGGLGGASNLVEKAAHLYGVPVITQPLGTRLWAPWSTGRIALFAVAAGLPVLSISAHVFGVMAIHWAALHVVLPTLLVALVLVLAGVPEATVVKKGAAAGLIAVAAYDCTRLPFVLLGLWHDFIPRVGGWVAVDEGPPTLHAVLGYTWRYFGNGMGIGVFFFIACAVLR